MYYQSQNTLSSGQFFLPSRKFLKPAQASHLLGSSQLKAFGFEGRIAHLDFLQDSNLWFILHGKSSLTAILVSAVFPYCCPVVTKRQSKPYIKLGNVVQRLSIITIGHKSMNQLNNRQRLWRRRFPNTTFTSLLLAASVAAPYGTVTAAQIEEIVVTAQKREQGSQDIGAAITAFGSDQLAKSDFNNIGDLQAMAPSLQIGESFGFAQIMIRGIGTDNPFAGGDPSVAMHIDGVVTGQSSAQFGSLFDIERVEVLRGPQGTLYGRNATGGSINVITQKPSEELNGYARVTVGNYELAKLEAAAGGALTDGVMGRIAVRALDRGGYGENIADGGDIDDAKQQSIRGQLLFEPSDTVSMRVSAERHEEDDTNYIPKFRSPSYDTAPLPALEPQPVDGTRASDPRDINSNVDLQNEREQASYSLEANWDINEVFSLTSLSNYQTFEKTPQADFDMTEVDFYIWSESFETEQTSQELQFNFSTDRVKGIVGFFYYHE